MSEDYWAAIGALSKIGLIIVALIYYPVTLFVVLGIYLLVKGL